MNKIEIEKQLLQLIEDIFNIEDLEINNTLTQDEINEWDSIGHVRLMMALENEFELKIPLAATVNLISIKKISDYLWQRLHDNDTSRF
jgi:acyl carrier protein